MREDFSFLSFFLISNTFKCLGTVMESCLICTAAWIGLDTAGISAIYKRLQMFYAFCKLQCKCEFQAEKYLLAIILTRRPGVFSG